jgi:Domain of unknown function (DUF5615)
MTLRFLTDEDFDNDFLRGLLRRLPDLDIARVQDVGLRQQPDPIILEWADRHGRIVVTHDVQTMPGHAYARLDAGQRVAGVCVIPRFVPIDQAIDDLVTIAECGMESDWENQVHFLPL